MLYVDANTPLNLRTPHKFCGTYVYTSTDFRNVKHASSVSSKQALRLIRCGDTAGPLHGQPSWGVGGAAGCSPVHIGSTKPHNTDE